MSSSPPPPSTTDGDGGMGRLFDDEAYQEWILPPSPSITGLSGPATGPDLSTAAATSSNDARQTPAAQAASSASALQRKRQATIANFLRQGESNATFKEKAPSILNTYWSAQQQQQQQQQNEEEIKQRAEQQQQQQQQQSRDSASGSTGLRSRPGAGAGAGASSSSITAPLLGAAGSSSDARELKSNPAPTPTSKPSAFERLLRVLAQRLGPKRRRRRRGTTRRRQTGPGAAGGGGGSGAAEEEEEERDGGEEEEEEEASSDSSDDEDGGEPGGKSSEEKAASTYRTELEEEEDVENTNFATVDWGRQDEHDFLDRDRLQEPLPPPKLASGGRGCFGVFLSKIVGALNIVWRACQQAWRAGQGWVICGLVGLSTGLLASMIDMCVHWVIDFRVGMCGDNIWLSNKNCCASIAVDNHSPAKNTNDLQQVCPLWRNWDTLLSNWGLRVGVMDDYISNYLVYVAISGMLAATSCWLVASWGRYAAGSGIPEIKTILGGVVIRRVLGPWTLLTKCVALVLSVSSGLSVGKEGPFVHIAACCGNILCKIFKRYRHNQAKTNEILSAACAAGVAVAFGAPIGGILYSLEEVSSFFPHKTIWRAFFCAIIASLSVTYIDPFQEGKLIQFGIDYTNPWQWFEMLPFFCIGCMGGLCGAFFIWANLKLNKARKASFLARIPLVEVTLVAMLSSTIKFQSAYTRGNVTSLLETLFSDCNSAPAVDPLDLCNIDFIGNTLGSLTFAWLVTLFLTTYTIGLPIPSGLLIPSLTTGAAMGRLVGTLVRYLQITQPSWGWGSCTAGDQACITPGIYALVGGAAVLGGVTRMTIALVVIMFEITGGSTYLLPIMVAVITSKVVGDSFGTDSIYEGAIEALNYPFLDVKHEIPSVLKVKDAMTPGADLLVLTIHGHTVASLTARLKTMTHLNISGFPIVTTQEEMLVVGYITRSELKAGLRYAMRHGGSGGSGAVISNTPCYFAMLDLRYPRTGPYVDLSGLLDPAPVQVSENMALYRLHDLFCKLGLRYCIVARFGKAVGFVTKKDICRQQHHGHEHDQKLKKQGVELPH